MGYPSVFMLIAANVESERLSLVLLIYLNFGFPFKTKTGFL